MSRPLRRIATGLAVAILVIVGAMALLLGTTLFALRAAPGDWSHRVAWGPFAIDLSVPALLRVASHPLGIQALAGRSVTTRFGRIRIDAGRPPDTLVVRCRPCTIDVPVLAAQPIRGADVEATIVRGEPNQLHGELRVDRVRAAWKARLSSQGAQLDVDVAETPFVDLVAVFGSAVPEAARARIDGRGGLAVHVALPSGRYAVEPHLDGLAVWGLGTDALVNAAPTPACARAPRQVRASAPFGRWLPKAVIAAEDQRFFEHPGYDAAEMAAAWSTDGPQARQRRGASTITQQLAKLLYTGDERSLARKVRELLYAVELERTLGKARILQLYLAVAPWGDGQCGGEAAALHYFGKHAASLDAAEAVWLAALLRNPERELARAARGEPAEAGRLAAIAAGLRPLGRARREAVQERLREAPPPFPVLARTGIAGGAAAAR